jgi:hypothetical protein
VAALLFLGIGCKTSVNSAEPASGSSKEPIDRPERPRMVRVERYPTVRAPSVVAPRAAFTIDVSLTMKEVTPEVSIPGQDAGTPLRASLPSARSWDIELVVVAPDFDLAGNDPRATLELPRGGDSSAAHFTLTAPIRLGRSPIWLTFWHEGQFIGEAVRYVSVGTPIEHAAPVHGHSREALSLMLGEQAPDLTLWVLTGESSQSGFGGVVLSSPWFESPQASPMFLSATLSKRADQEKLRFGQGSHRSPSVPLPDGEVLPPDLHENITSARVFGRHLYHQLFPENVKRALAAIYERRGRGFSMQIYTSDPAIPWELASFKTWDGEWRDFLGMEASIARWHIDEEHRGKQRPPGTLRLGKMLSVVPRYEGRDRLPAAAAEPGLLPASLRARVVNPSIGRREALVTALRQEAEGIDVLYFAGHGAVKEGASDFFILLEGGDTLAASEWPLLTAGAPVPRFVFLNACSQGQESLVGGKMAGWARAVIEAGGDAYLGGLWPLGDAAAAEFAAHFYRRAAEGLPLAEAVRHARARFLATGDPTYIAYVFYGDPRLRLSLSEDRP